MAPSTRLPWRRSVCPDAPDLRIGGADLRGDALHSYSMARHLALTYQTARSNAITGQVFIHPDGTRLLWDVGQLEVFDLTTRKIVNEFKFGLPSTSGTSMQMSQDGSKVYVGNGLGAVVILDTRYGNMLASYQETGPSQVFGGPPAN
jgi:hypothetical protein